MPDLITLDQMLYNLKDKYKNSIKATEKTTEIINKIIKSRKFLGYSKKEVAEKCNISQSMLSRIETFDFIPDIITLLKIASAVGITIVVLNDDYDKS